MQDLLQQNEDVRTSFEASKRDALVNHLRKLRWMGLSEDAQKLERELQNLLAISVPIEAPDTD